MEASNRTVVAVRLSAVALLVTLFSLLIAPGASADVTIGGPGAGGGQYKVPRGLAVDQAKGILYVADTGNNRVDVFEADGVFLRAFGWDVVSSGPGEKGSAFEVCEPSKGDVCQAGSKGPGAGQFSGIVAIAVDNDPTSPAFHDVYTVDGSRVQRFTPAGEFVLTFGDEVNKTTKGDVCTAASGNTCGAGISGKGPGQLDEAKIAIGGGGTVHVADHIGTGARLQRFDPTGAFLNQLAPLPPGDAKSSRVLSLALDSTDNFYIATNGIGSPVRKYGPAGNLFAEIPAATGNLALATDDADNLYVAQNIFIENVSGGLGSDIHRYDSSGSLLRVLYSEEMIRLRSLAAYSSPGGDIFGAEETDYRVVHIPLPASGPAIGPGALQAGEEIPLGDDVSTKVTQVGSASAVLSTTINPEGKATTYRFEYVDQETFEAEGFASPVKTSETAIGADFELHRVSQKVIGLSPETVYRFRGVASNADGSDAGPVASFETREPFEILATWSTDVDSSSASLHAEVNPLGIPATGYFEYVDEATFQASGFAEAVKAPNIGGGQSPIDFGAGEKPQRRSATLFPLEPDTKYRYHVVVENQFTSEAGSERIFTTPSLPDSGVDCPNSTFRTGASARLPDCRAYELVSPIEKNNTNIAGPVLGISQASVTGNGMTFTSPRAFADSEGAPLYNPFVAFRDSAEGWRTQAITPPRKSPSLYPNGGDNGYPYRAFSPDLCSGWIQHDADVALAPGAPAGVPNLYRRDLCGDGGYELLSSVAPPGHKFEPDLGTYYPDIMGFSADNTRSVFRANAPLTPNANPISGFYQTYVSDEGKLRLVSVLPNGGAANGEAVPGQRQFVSLTFRYDNVYRAVSADASRVFWSMSAYAANPGLDGSQGSFPSKLYLRLNATEPQSLISGGKCTQPARACTIAISETLGARYESAATDGSRVIYTIGGDLYEADIEEIGGQMASVPQQIAKGVISVIGASEDAQRIYFASKEVLTGAEQNSEGDSAVADKANLYLYEKGAGFEFVATLVGWDTDTYARGNAELSPLARTPGKRTSRVSPDGMHAAFTSIASLTGYDNADANSGEPDAQVYLYDAASGELACASCNPSGARPKGGRIRNPVNTTDKGDWAAALIPGWSNHLQPTRALSDDGGRLFFEAFDALLPRDTNGRKDVYQWEAPGSGDCTEESSSFSEQNEGCISLISSGESPVDSEFLDASPSGADVFFLTQSSLVNWDPSLADVYDARVDGGLPGPAVPPPACEGEACQGPVAPPNDPTPASSTYQGPGNVKEASKQVKKAKRKQAKRKRQRAKRRAQAKRRQAARRANAKGRTGR